MKILAEDRKLAKQIHVSAYIIAQARELQELACSNHPFAEKAREAADRVLAGDLEIKNAYRLVQLARGDGSRALLSAQIDAGLLADLKALAKECKQLFRDMVEDMVREYLHVNGIPQSQYYERELYT